MRSDWRRAWQARAGTCLCVNSLQTIQTIIACNIWDAFHTYIQALGPWRTTLLCMTYKHNIDKEVMGGSSGQPPIMPASCHSVSIFSATFFHRHNRLVLQRPEERFEHSSSYQPGFILLARDENSMARTASRRILTPFDNVALARCRYRYAIPAWRCLRHAINGCLAFRYAVCLLCLGVLYPSRRAEGAQHNLWYHTCRLSPIVLRLRLYSLLLAHSHSSMDCI